MNRCTLFANRRHRLYDACMEQLGRAFASIEVVDSGDQSDEALVCREADLVVSFLSDRILRGPALELESVNFHPAPPSFPGRGSASYALFEGSPIYGATAHRMVQDIDAGEILLVEEFPIEADDTCESVFAQGEQACIVLLEQLVTYIIEHGELPPPNGRRWARRAATRKDFQEWLMLDPSDEEGFYRKIKAARHSKFPGPYVRIHGQLFALSNEEDVS